jgi:hypothetical protein
MITRVFVSKLDANSRDCRSYKMYLNFKMFILQDAFTIYDRM